jgi:type II secretory pathway pseudopilin PulG
MKRKKGMSYVEILVATIFVATCAAVITDSLGVSLGSIARMERRLAALTLIKDELSKARIDYLTNSPIAGTYSMTHFLPGSRDCQVTTIIGNESMTDYTDVTTKAEWVENKNGREYTESLRLKTYVRIP